MRSEMHAEILRFDLVCTFHPPAERAGEEFIEI